MITDISPGAGDALAACLARDGRQKILLTADANTAGYARGLLARLPDTAGLFVYPTRDLLPDEAAVGRLLIAAGGGVDALVAVGSGTLNDLTRYVSFRLGKPYYVAATAASMDGYTSAVAPLVVDGLKTTYAAHAPRGVFADPGVLAAAPPIMTAAGYGDLMGKHTSLLDWELEDLVRETRDFVPDLAAQMRAAVALGEDCESGDAAAVLRALLASGDVMAAAGHSKPASGSEHHLAHYWETSQRPALHGVRVGVAVLMVLRVARALAGAAIDWESAYKSAESFDIMAWQTDVRRAYGRAAEGVIALWPGESAASRVGLVARLRAVWPRVTALLGQAALPADVEAGLRRMGGPTDPVEIGITREEFSQGFLHAHRIRPRFTVYRMADILGVLTHYAQESERMYYGQQT